MIVDREHAAQLPVMTAEGKLQNIRQRMRHAVPQWDFFLTLHRSGTPRTAATLSVGRVHQDVSALTRPGDVDHNAPSGQPGHLSY